VDTKQTITSKWAQKLEQTLLGTEWQLSISYHRSLENIRRAMDNNKALVVSNGSFQEQSGACTWIIEGETSADRIEGSMHTPGQMSDHSSFRSKAASIYGALLNIWFFVEEYITKGTITIACDGRSVLDRLNSKKTIDPFAAHSDLLRASESIHAQLN